MGRTSSKRDEILHFLTKFTAENGYAPSVRESVPPSVCNPRRPSIIT